MARAAWCWPRRAAPIPTARGPSGSKPSPPRPPSRPGASTCPCHEAPIVAGAHDPFVGVFTTPVADGGYGFPESKLWATVYESDDEAFEIWNKVVGLPADRIQRRDAKDNYWSMGVPGPGGPCSEIYYDRGPEHGREGGPEADEDRYLEVWNLVFMQDELSAVRSKED